MKFSFCVACLDSKDLHHHHLVPRSKGGSNAEQNLITLCTKCHKSIHGQSWSGQNHGKLTSDAQMKLKAEGKPWTKEVYGWSFKNGKATPIKREQKIVNEIIKRREAGSSYASIVRDLNKRCVRTKSGKEWYRSTVRSVYITNT